MEPCAGRFVCRKTILRRVEVDLEVEHLSTLDSAQCILFDSYSLSLSMANH